MIVGIGTDLIEVERVRKACSNEAFLARYFTLKEIELISGDMAKAAGNFAVKESVAKVFGTGFRGFMPKDIEVLRNELGKPYICLHGGAAELAGKTGIEKIHVSITNTKEHASAFAVGEGADHAVFIEQPGNETGR